MLAGIARLIEKFAPIKPAPHVTSIVVVLLIRDAYALHRKGMTLLSTAIFLVHSDIRDLPADARLIMDTIHAYHPPRGQVPYEPYCCESRPIDALDVLTDSANSLPLNAIHRTAAN